MSAQATDIRTAGITPHLFAGNSVRARSRALLLAALTVLTLAGFGLRAYRLGAEGLSEDELNKVKAVSEYREHGLTPANGEHPFLMKALLAVSIVSVETWNSSSIVASNPDLAVSTEAAARLPGVILGALSALLIFLLASELFGTEVGLIAAALWAFDPAAIGFNRIAKEDSFLVFFFLLANVFWTRGQRVAEGVERNPEPFYWAAAASFGAMLASKYVPHFLAISSSYYYAFQGVRGTRWRLGKKKWLVFFAVMGAAFIICNPTILLPGTWHEMRVFAGEKRIGHDAYEYMGALYRNQMSLWLTGSPWHFYYVFMGVKLPLLTLLGVVVGLPILFRRKLGDGRYLLIFWLFFWFFPFTVLGGKFTRYFTFALPLVIVTSAIGLHSLSTLAARAAERLKLADHATSFAKLALPALAVVLAAYASAGAAPFYRLYTNAIGGGDEKAGFYFPHDEFYDGSTPDVARSVAAVARPGALVASETPELLSYYLRRAGREDIRSVSLSDRAALSELEAGDLIVLARGRRYFSNETIWSTLPNVLTPSAVVSQGRFPAARVYLLDTAAREKMAGLFQPQTL